MLYNHPCTKWYMWGASKMLFVRGIKSIYKRDDKFDSAVRQASGKTSLRRESNSRLLERPMVLKLAR